MNWCFSNANQPSVCLILITMVGKWYFSDETLNGFYFGAGTCYALSHGHLPGYDDAGIGLLGVTGDIGYKKTVQNGIIFDLGGEAFLSFNGFQIKVAVKAGYGW